MKPKEFSLEINGKAYSVTIHDFTAANAEVEVNGNKYDVNIKDLGIEQVSDLIPKYSVVEVPKVPVHKPELESQLFKPTSVTNLTAIMSPLPGLIVKILVKEGDQVKAGQTLLIMEAMKMENEISAKADGTVTAIHVKEGDSVEEGIELISVK